mgnify:CR=1 FL=1
MATKSFGVKELKIDGSGTPTIESPSGGNLNITAGNTVVSGNMSVAGDLTGDVTGTATTATNLANAANITTGTINVARLGIGTADDSVFLRGDNTWQTVSGGSSTFVGLSDTPTDFTNAANKNVVVNNAGNALEFVASGTSSNEILPVAYAFVNADTAGTGTGMTWGAYDNNNSSATYGEMDFTFGTPLSDANYYVLSEREQYDTHSVRITNKTTGGFTATWLGNDGSSPLAPSLFGGVLIVYASTPTKSVGAGWNEALPTATANDLGAIKIGSGLSIDGNGVVTASGGGGSLASRTTKNATITSLAAGASGNLSITAFKAYNLLKIAIDHPAWVRLYVDAASRTSDASRAEGTDPLPGSGVIAEVLTTDTGGGAFLMSPAVFGWNNDGPPATTVYARVTNKDSSSRDITVILTLIEAEA